MYGYRLLEHVDFSQNLCIDWFYESVSGKMCHFRTRFQENEKTSDFRQLTRRLERTSKTDISNREEVSGEATSAIGKRRAPHEQIFDRPLFYRDFTKDVKSVKSIKFRTVL